MSRLRYVLSSDNLKAIKSYQNMPPVSALIYWYLSYIRLRILTDIGFSSLSEVQETNEIVSRKASLLTCWEYIRVLSSENHFDLLNTVYCGWEWHAIICYQYSFEKKPHISFHLFLLSMSISLCNNQISYEHIVMSLPLYHNVNHGICAQFQTFIEITLLTHSMERVYILDHFGFQQCKRGHSYETWCNC